MKILELTHREKCKVLLKKTISKFFVFFGGYRVVKKITKPGIAIVVYHRIISDDHKGVRPYISVTESNLRRQIKFYKKEYTLLSLNEAIEKLQSGTLESPCLVITFDDGYEDNYSLGLKVFQEEGIRPTVFITTVCIERKVALWPDRLRNLLYQSNIDTTINLGTPAITIRSSLSSRVQAVKTISAYIKTLDLEQRENFLNNLEIRLGPVENPQSLMLDWDQVRILAKQGVIIGSHTVNHPVLAQIPEELASFEIIESKRILEEKTGRKINMLAYPNGTIKDFTPGTINLIRRSGYTAAITTLRGVNRIGSDLFRLRRTGVYLTDSITDIKCKLALESLIY